MPSLCYRVYDCFKKGLYHKLSESRNGIATMKAEWNKTPWQGTKKRSYQTMMGLPEVRITKAVFERSQRKRDWPEQARGFELTTTGWSH